MHRFPIFIYPNTLHMVLAVQVFPLCCALQQATSGCFSMLFNCRLAPALLTGPLLATISGQGALRLQGASFGCSLGLQCGAAKD